MSEDTMINAHKAGIAYWERNKPYDATRKGLMILARSCGWRGENAVAWLAGFYGAKDREPRIRTMVERTAEQRATGSMPGLGTITIKE